MIEFGGTYYYIDLTAFDKAITPLGYKISDEIKTREKKNYLDKNGVITGSEEYETIHLRGKEIDTAKFDLLRTLIEVIIDYQGEEIDTTLGVDRVLEKSPLSFKIAFNTLYNYGILKEK